ncbi:hypothetical protein CDAR_416821 [Caerostris darwini]|uniref:Uncharacterized protein n=1 Tax=Caerostris darwini TaxID=1538125 RepID=A0AAV4X8U1_9ARAC|nr:hypothetical protein CDAR_416821 [Caerostris darwini]
MNSTSHPLTFKSIENATLSIQWPANKTEEDHSKPNRISRLSEHLNKKQKQNSSQTPRYDTHRGSPPPSKKKGKESQQDPSSLASFMCKTAFLQKGIN